MNYYNELEKNDKTSVQNEDFEIETTRERRRGGEKVLVLLIF
jgi:hypothetical protein